MRRKGIFGAMPLLILLMSISIGLLCLFGVYVCQDKVIISHDSGIYNESFLLEVKCIRPGIAYYTMDGSIPEVGGSQTFIYDEAIPISLGKETQVYSLQIKYIYEDGEESPVFMRDFILEEQGTQRYQTNYVVNITGEENLLWGYEEGIFVRGRQFDEYMKENPNVDILSTVIPANYYNEVEVPVHVSVFTNTGQEVITKNCGLRIYGNVTRAKNQKSFRLYARDVYDGKNEFVYPLIPDLISEETGRTIDEFQRISFHNSGNDNGYAFVRNTLIGKLAEQFGFDEVLLSQSAAVYVNGRYQGMYWLQNTYDDKYFKEKYGSYEGEMVVCEGKLNKMSAAEDATISELECTDDYNKFCEWLLGADLSVDENWEKVCDTIDIVNFAKYMAIEYYIGNTDWPHNNVKAYKYMPAEGKKQESSNKIFDGKYRYLLFDTDYGMGLKFLGWFGNDETWLRLESLCNVEGSAGIFGKMMQREEFRNTFVNAVLILTEGAFSADNVRSVLDEFILVKDGELKFMFEETDLLKNSLWESDDNTFFTVGGEMAEINTYAENRPAIVREEMQQVLAGGALVRVLAELPEEEGVFLINGIEAGNVYSGYCYENIPMLVNCNLRTGSRVQGYFVNDEYVEGSTLRLDISTISDKEKKIVIIPQIEVFAEEELSIIAYDVDGTEDYILLRNTGNVDLMLSDYSVTDSVEVSKGRLPALVLKPNEVYYVYGKQYSGEIAKNGVKMSFSWSDEEDIILSNNIRGIIEQR